jgi:AraC-like DNA-binding protein
MTNQEMAAIACFSPCHFNRLFHRVTGIPPIQFHYALRIARAKEMLIETDLGVTEICFEVGYNSLGTFITRFNELVGLSPSAFRRLARRIAGMCLADFPLSQFELCPAATSAGGITGVIQRDLQAGVIFTGLFRRAIPQGRPSACALLWDGSSYALPVPRDGVWHAMAVTVPPDVDGTQLLTLKGLARGRSAPIIVRHGRWYGDAGITLAMPSPRDPPILAAIPIQIAHLDGRSSLRSYAAQASSSTQPVNA